MRCGHQGKAGRDEEDWPLCPRTLFSRQSFQFCLQTTPSIASLHLPGPATVPLVWGTAITGLLLLSLPIIPFILSQHSSQRAYIQTKVSYVPPFLRMQVASIHQSSYKAPHDLAPVISQLSSAPLATLTYSTPATAGLLTHAKHMPAAGPLHVLYHLSGTSFLSELNLYLPRPWLRVPFSARPCSALPKPPSYFISIALIPI